MVAMKLPLSDPLIKTYKHHAFILSMIPEPHHLKCYTTTNYIQLFSPHNIMNDPDCDLHWLDFLIVKYDDDFFRKKMIYFSELKQYNLEHLIESEVNKGNYLYLFYDSFYLEHTMFYKKEHTPSNLLIYGYSNENGQMFVDLMDYDLNQTGKLISYSLPIEKLNVAIKALDATPFPWAEYSCIYTPTHASYEYNMNTMKELLQDYISSAPTYKKYIASEETFFEQSLYGLEIYQGFYSYYNWLLQGRSVKNLLPFCILEEHKKNMVILGRYLLEEAERTDEDLINELDIIQKKAENLKNLMIMYYITDNLELVKRMTRITQYIEKHEREVLPRLLDKIKI